MSKKYHIKENQSHFLESVFELCVWSSKWNGSCEMLPMQKHFRFEQSNGVNSVWWIDSICKSNKLQNHIYSSMWFTFVRICCCHMLMLAWLGRSLVHIWSIQQPKMALKCWLAKVFAQIWCCNMFAVIHFTYDYWSIVKTLTHPHDDDFRNVIYFMYINIKCI